jgi:hypothetical protein
MKTADRLCKPLASCTGSSTATTSCGNQPGTSRVRVSNVKSPCDMGVTDRLFLCATRDFSLSFRFAHVTTALVLQRACSTQPVQYPKE